MASSLHPSMPWSTLAVLTLAGVLLVGLGGMLGLTYCEYRQASAVQQLTQTAGDCVGLLKEVVPVTIILARNERPRAIALSMAVRDSLREARWVKP